MKNYCLLIKKIIFVTLFILLSLHAKSFASNLPELCGQNSPYIIFNEKTFEIVSQNIADKVIYPASLTKLMTLYLTFEAIEAKKISPDDTIKISSQAEDISNVNKINSLKLKEGDKITVRQAIRGAIVKSFNEATIALAEKVAGSEIEFVKKMNEKASKLGMTNTSFRNASGLHHQGQYSTNYDLARLTAALIKNFPGYYYLFALKEFEFRDNKYKTHNHFLEDYEWAQGMKTGYTSAAGFNLIASAKKGDVFLVAIITGCPTFQSRDQFAKKIFDFAFELENKGSKEFKLKLQNHSKD